MGDLCSCWDAIHNVIILQHNEIKASFKKSINLISDAYKGGMYKRLVGIVSRHALGLIADEVERVNHIGFDSGSCGCVLRATYGLPCACELARYVYGVIPPTVLHIMWTRLSFSNISSNESLPRLCIDKEIDMVVNRFSEVDIVGKVTIKQKLHEIACHAMTSMVAPMRKVKTKGAQQKKGR